MKEAKVQCRCIKEIFKSATGGFKVYSFVPTGGEPIEVNKYGNFSISGEQTFDVGQEYFLSLSTDEKSKYPCSYIFEGYVGIGFVGEDIKVDPEAQVRILSMYMEKSQAEACTEAYPNFLELILSDRENEIDIKSIHGVGDKLFAKYCDKLRGDCKTVLFAGVLNSYGKSTASACLKAALNFSSPTSLRNAIESDPYGILHKLYGRTVKQIDKTLNDSRPEFLTSKSRCRQALMDLIDEFEDIGSTRCDANVLANILKSDYPQCAKWIAECIMQDNDVYFDSEAKYVSRASTFEAEEYIGNELKERVNNPIQFDGDIESFRQIGTSTMTDEQIGALEMVKNYSTGVLCGVAGTGKSTAINGVIKYLESIDKTYVLLAPTGCAAKRLKDTTGRPTFTIHKWLMNRINCNADVLICDEFGMVGVDLFKSVLCNIYPNTKVFMVCDPFQLASISCGNLAQDIINSGVVPVTRLTKVFRYNSSGIATVVTDTRNGSAYHIDSDEFDDYIFSEQEDDTADMLDLIKDAYGYYLDKGYGMKDVLCLCPYNKGSLGSRAINKMLQQEFNPHDYTNVECEYYTGKEKDEDGEESATKDTINFKIGDKVINKVNDYEAIVYKSDLDIDEEPETTFIANGDIGTVVDYTDDSGLIVAFDEETILFEKSSIKNLRLAYSISVHSSQGSESPVVIALMLKQHRYMINRNIEYVAFSRAKTELCIIGDKPTIANGMKEVQNLERDTWLCEMLKENS